MVTSGNFASQIIPSALTPAAQHQRLIPKAGGAATRTTHAELGRGLDQGAGPLRLPGGASAKGAEHKALRAQSRAAPPSRSLG